MMFCFCYDLDGLWDGKQVTVQLQFCWVLLLGFVQDSTKILVELPSSLFSFSFLSFVLLVSRGGINTVVPTLLQIESNAILFIKEISST